MNIWNINLRLHGSRTILPIKPKTFNTLFYWIIPIELKSFKLHATNWTKDIYSHFILATTRSTFAICITEWYFLCNVHLCFYTHSMSYMILYVYWFWWNNLLLTRLWHSHWFNHVPCVNKWWCFSSNANHRSLASCWS